MTSAHSNTLDLNTNTGLERNLIYDNENESDLQFKKLSETSGMKEYDEVLRTRENHGDKSDNSSNTSSRNESSTPESDRESTVLKERKKFSRKDKNRMNGSTSSTSSLRLEASPLIKESNDTQPNGENNRPSGVIQAGGRKVFIEPDLAGPNPSYTGLPLEAFPTTKIKKESLWPQKGAKKSSKSSSKEPQPSTFTEENENSTEALYNSGLKTDLSEDITSYSDEREPIELKVPRKRSSSFLKEKSRTPKKPRKNVEEHSPLRASKRIKVISPKRSSRTNLAPSSIPGGDASHSTGDDQTKDNDDFCTSCGEPGVFICCDSCPKSFHFTCCDPPLEEVPEENWHCHECVARMNPQYLTQWNDIGIFGQLLNQQEGRNPKQYELPKYLRENTFVGVSTGENGRYQDSTTKPDLPLNKINGSQIIGCNKNDDLEIESLYKKNGKPYLCHKCGMSGLKHKTLVHCDYCPLIWHLDCLNEILCIPKTIGSKWRCPNHVEELLPQDFGKLRQFKGTSVVDVALHNQFLKIAAMNNLIIKFDNQAYLKEGKFPHLQEYLNFQNEYYKFNTNFIDNLDNYEADDSTPYKIPDYFQNYSTSIGITAKSSNKLHKVITMTTGDVDNGSFIYRVPERLISLDFISKVKSKKPIKKLEILSSIQDYENNKRLEQNEDERMIVDGLFEVKASKPSNLNFNELVKVALQDQNVEPKITNKQSPSRQLHNDEIADLLSIKKLMELKGKEKLLHFLRS
ncbi:uncharacterized protein PRCAT00001731001 [Priceomyces carsonii]|uniref:uncharacterized protein n=1 Tax=Priceomyces carsonii TaxID=28549 RepID=UPI002EDA602D|nr:unnamed protein product [Priceomyces carsonii]